MIDIILGLLLRNYHHWSKVQFNCNIIFSKVFLTEPLKMLMRGMHSLMKEELRECPCHMMNKKLKIWNFIHLLNHLWITLKTSQHSHMKLHQILVNFQKPCIEELKECLLQIMTNQLLMLLIMELLMVEQLFLRWLVKIPRKTELMELL